MDAQQTGDMAIRPRVSIVILNYRTPGLTIDCLESLRAQMDGRRIRAVVVDNCSGDGSAEILRAHVRDAGLAPLVDVVEAPSNGGFAAGNNVGLRHRRADYYLLLNSDTIVREGAIERLLAHAQAHPRCGLVAPRLEWPDGEQQVSCFRFHSPASEFIAGAHTAGVTRALARFDVPLGCPPEARPVPWASFACILLHDALRAATGGLDEGFFMYFEDAAYCLQARRLGWETWFEPAARVIHLRGGSSDVKARQQQRRRPPAYLYASRSRFLRQAHGALGPLAANLAWLAGRLIGRSKEWILRRPVTSCEAQWRDIWIGALRPAPSRPSPR